MRAKTYVVERCAPMQMRSGGAAGMADQADDLSLFDGLSRFDFCFFQMGVDGLQPLTVVDNYHVAGVKIVLAAQNYLAGTGSFDRRPFGGGNIGTAVRTFGDAVENALIAELAADTSVNRQDEAPAPVIAGLKVGKRTAHIFLFAGDFGVMRRIGSYFCCETPLMR